jgi:hypothetical protein
MRKNWLLSLLALSLTALTVQGGCVIIPEVNTKIVELVASGTACDTLTSLGTINNHDETDVIDLKNGIDIQQALEDAGIDVSEVTEIAVWGVTYKTTQPDPTAGRQIVNGNVTVERGSYIPISQTFMPDGGGAVDLITNFNIDVNSVTTDQTAPIAAAGITLLNQILNDCLEEAKGNGPASNTAIRYHVTGQSLPMNVATDFKWRICVKLNMKGKVEVDVVE